METQPADFDPTARTIRKVIEPHFLPYLVVINNWDPRDGTHDLEQTKEFAKQDKWPTAHTVIRHYKLHARASADGLVVTEYPLNRVALQAREDFTGSRWNSTSGERGNGTRPAHQPGIARRARRRASPVNHAGNGHAQPSAAVLSELTANPRNPRDDLGDLDDLASIVDIQLQPAVVVSRTAYQRLYPEDAIATRWVVINGCRRLAAAHRYGRADLEIIVKDELARDRITLLTAAISENVDRVDFDVIEEARAVEALARECGSAGEASAGSARPTAGYHNAASC